MRLATRALVILSAGFCLLGADFGRSDLASLVLGQTTEQQARERFGDPARQSTNKVADKVVTSSFTVDDTDFAESAAREIKRGVTTRAEVHRLVGRPAGEYVFPSPAVRVAGQRADIYNSSRNTSSSPSTSTTS